MDFFERALELLLFVEDLVLFASSLWIFFINMKRYNGVSIFTIMILIISTELKNIGDYRSPTYTWYYAKIQIGTVFFNSLSLLPYIMFESEREKLKNDVYTHKLGISLLMTAIIVVPLRAFKLISTRDFYKLCNSFLNAVALIPQHNLVKREGEAEVDAYVFVICLLFHYVFHLAANIMDIRNYSYSRMVETIPTALAWLYCYYFLYFTKIKEITEHRDSFGRIRDIPYHVDDDVEARHSNENEGNARIPIPEDVHANLSSSV